MKPKRRNSQELYDIMSQAIAYMRLHADRQPASQEVAKALVMSSSRFDHIFKQWVGISPRRFVSYITKEKAKRLLQESHDVLKVSYKAGLSSPSRLHDLLVTYEAVSPGEFKQGGIDIWYGIHSSPFGHCVIGVTKRGICKISFTKTDNDREAQESILETWPEANLIRDDKKSKKYSEQLFGKRRKGYALPLLVKGTNFQIKVWEALLAIPEGGVSSYRDIAALVGSPGASRAVGTACSKNPIGFIIPCHRVLTSQGGLGGYYWGLDKKEAMLAWEAVRQK